MGRFIAEIFKPKQQGIFMTLKDYDRPFADQANRMAHMPWTLRGYRPLVERPSLRQALRSLITSIITRH